MDVVASTQPALPSQNTDSVPSLTPIEREVIDFFVAIARLLAQPKSVAEIYGLLFISKAPLSMAEIIERLGLSKGSASQGLRFLQEVGAIHRLETEGERRGYFEAETVLKNIVGGYLRQEVTPHVSSGKERLARIHDSLKETEDLDHFYQHRIARLGQWYRRGGQLLPIISRFFSGK